MHSFQSSFQKSLATIISLVILLLILSGLGFLLHSLMKPRDQILLATFDEDAEETNYISELSLVTLEKETHTQSLPIDLEKDEKNKNNSNLSSPSLEEVINLSNPSSKKTQLVGTSYSLLSGGFITQKRRLGIEKNLLYFYPESDQISLSYQTASLESKGNIPILETEGTLQALSLPNYGKIWMTVTTEEKNKEGQNEKKVRCYLANFGEVANTIGEGRNCFLSDDTSTLVYEVVDNQTSSLYEYKVNSSETVNLSNSIENLENFKISPKGKKIAYVQRSKNDEYRLSVLDTTSKQINSGDQSFFKVLDYEFSNDEKSLYYIVEKSDGKVELYLWGESEPISKGYGLRANFSPNSETLVYCHREKDSSKLDTLNSYSLKTKTTTEITKRENIYYGFSADSDKLFISYKTNDEGNYNLLIANQEGTNLKEIVNQANYFYIYNVGDPNFTYVKYYKKEKYYLLVIPLKDVESNPTLLLEKWSDINVYNFSTDKDKKIVFSGKKDKEDHLKLYVQKLTSENPVVINQGRDEDSFKYVNAVFSRDNNSVFYTSQIGDNPKEKDWESNVQETQLLDNKETKTIGGSNQTLRDINWTELNPFNNYLSLQSLYTSSVPFFGADQLKIGQEETTTLSPKKDQAYAIELEKNQFYTITAKPENNSIIPLISVFDRMGNEDRYSENIAYHRYPSNGAKKYIIQTNKEGIYYAKIYEDENDKYSDVSTSVRLDKGIFESGFTNAESINFDEPKENLLSPENTLFNLSLAWNSIDTKLYKFTNKYGKIYTFNGEKGEEVSIYVKAKSLDASSFLDSMVFLLAPDLTVVTYDDDSGDDSDSSIFNQRLPITGTYYILVTHYNNSIDSSEDYFYQLLLTRD